MPESGALTVSPSSALCRMIKMDTLAAPFTTVDVTRYHLIVRKNIYHTRLILGSCLDALTVIQG